MTKKNLILATATLIALTSAGVLNARAMQTSGKWESTNGIWRYYDANGNIHKSWLNLNGKWYYLDKSTGNMLTKWQNIDGKWYFFDNTLGSNSGSMLSGWQWIDGYCYYFGSGEKDLGKMYAGEITPDGYMTNASGHWVEKDGTQHYLINKGYSTQAEKSAKSNTNIRFTSSGGGSFSRDFNVSKIEKAEVENKVKDELEDGIWYGTGTWSRYYEQYGPDIVIVTIKDGKIEKAESVKYTEDELFTKSLNVLDKLAGYKDTDEIKKQFKEKKGEAYDVVSSATEGANGEVSAVDNALARSRKFKKDKKEQKIAYYDFNVKPDAQAIGEKLDLSKTVLKAHMMDGSVRDISFNEFSDYGIRTTPEHNSILPAIGTNFLIKFINEDSLITMPSSAQVQKNYINAYPDTIKITYEDGKEKDVKLNDNHFVYEEEFAESKIKSVALYMKDNKLVDAKYESVRDIWEMSLKGIKTPKDYDIWGFETYQLRERVNEANIPVKLDILDGDESVLGEDIKVPEDIAVEGSAKVEDIEIEKKYENTWNGTTFTVKAVNKNGEKVETTVAKKEDYLEITFPRYRTAKHTIKLLVKFKYVELNESADEAEDGATETNSGENAETGHGEN